MDSAITFIFQLAILIFSVVIHEVSHGLAANAMGDSTAKYAGRLTLNPIKHLDPIGSLFVPLLGFLFGGIIIGWAKPVPYNPYNLQVRNKEIGSAMVGVAGPAANIFVAFIFGLSIRIFGGWIQGLGETAIPLAEIMGAIVFINLALAVFNLVPVPPLDGSKVLFSLLPYRWQGIKMALERFGFILLLLFIFYFSHWILPAVWFLFRFITGVNP